MWTPTDENIATLTDFVVDQSITDYQRATFNPEKFPEHAAIKRRQEANRKLPPPLPSVVPVARRPAGVVSLAVQFSDVTTDVEDKTDSSDITISSLDDLLTQIALN